MDQGTRKVLRFDRFLLDLTRGCLRAGEQDIDLRPKAFQLLTYLAANAGRLVPKQELIEAVWPHVVVSDESLEQCIRQLRRGLGDADHRLIKTVPRRGYLFDAAVSLVGDAAVSPKLSLAPNIREQAIKYCRSRDGVRLAYAIAGSGPPLVKAGNWLHHLEYDWESPVWRHLLWGLAKNHTLIRYDARGNGLSDWEVDELSLDAWVNDLETVVEATGVERFPLLGISQGCAISVAYAVRHPERVSHLVLYGGYVLGAKKRTPDEKEKREAMLRLARLEWGSDNPAFRQLFTGNFMPDATAEQADFFNELQRRTTSPGCAARYMDATGDFDIRKLLPKVTVPTLVMHVRGDLMVPLESGSALAAGIPGARFVSFPGHNHFFLEHEPASTRFFEEVSVFLGGR
jgi:pimeloyl-ACP methyl ester carboxylesterase/DNA-binding winged helix-turn-helix (wHTH) protein